MFVGGGGGGVFVYASMFVFVCVCVCVCVCVHGHECVSAGLCECLCVYSYHCIRIFQDLAKQIGEEGLTEAFLSSTNQVTVHHLPFILHENCSNKIGLVSVTARLAKQICSKFHT